MFTGLIQTVGQISTIEHHGTNGDHGCVLTIQTDSDATTFITDADPLTLGESITINGVCTTVVDIPTPHQFTVELSPETLNITTLGHLAVNSICNLERAMKAGDRFGGHIVSGHVDTLAQVIDRTVDGDSWRFYFRLKDPANAQYFIPKGSVAIDGISLTVNGLNIEKSLFDVAIIPHTMNHTTFATLTPDTWVNIECDIIGKYAASMLQPYALNAENNQNTAEQHQSSEQPDRISEAFTSATMGNSNIHTGRWFNLG